MKEGVWEERKLLKRNAHINGPPDAPYIPAIRKPSQCKVGAQKR